MAATKAGPVRWSWVPRALAIAFALFLGVFALDVFQEGYALGPLLLALLMHLVPSMLVLLALGVAWRWSRWGGWLFIALGAAYMAIFWHPARWPAYLIISGPAILIGVLFLLSAQPEQDHLH